MKYKHRSWFRLKWNDNVLVKHFFLPRTKYIHYIFMRTRSNEYEYYAMVKKKTIEWLEHNELLRDKN